MANPARVTSTPAHVDGLTNGTAYAVRGRSYRLIDPALGDVAGNRLYSAWQSVSGGPWTPASTGSALYVAPSGSGGSDTASGDATHPFATLERADTAAATLGPGAVVNVAPGTYGQATLDAAGTAGSRVRWVSTTPGGAKVPFGIMVAGDYIDFQGFDVDGRITPVASASGNNVGVWLQGHGARAIGNVVHDGSIADSANGGSGILGAGLNYDVNQVSQEVIGNLVYNIGSGDLTSNARVQGIYLAAVGCKAKNNVIAFCVADGITSWHAASGLSIVNNTLYCCRFGILVGTGDSGATAAGNQGSYVANNVCVSNVFAGWIEEGNTGTATYVNNLGWDNNWDPAGGGANQNHAAPGTTLYNTPVGMIAGSSTVSGQLVSNPLLASPPSPSLTTRPAAGSVTSAQFKIGTGSPAIGSGTTGAEVPSTDLAGVTRPSPPARGALEP